MCELSEGAGSTWVAAVSEDWKHNDCRLLLKPLQTQHNAHGCYCTRVSQLRVGAGGVTCRWRLTIAQYRSVIFGFCTDRCTYWPFAHLSRTVNLLCALMLWREMQWKSLPGRRIFTAKRDAISSLRSEFLITFFFFFLTTIWISIWTSFHAWPAFHQRCKQKWQRGSELRGTIRNGWRKMLPRLLFPFKSMRVAMVFKPFDSLYSEFKPR